MVRQFVEDQQVGVGDDRPTKRDAAFFSARQSAHQPFRIRRVEVRHRSLDPRVDVPRAGRCNLLFQFGLPVGIRRKRLVLPE